MCRLLVIVGTILFFKRAGEIGDGHRIGGGSVVPALASAALWGVVLFLLHWGFWFGLLLQVGLFLLITIRNVVKADRAAARRSGD